MNKSYHAIPTTKMVAPCHYVQPPELPEVIHINDPATVALVDFRYHRPPTITTDQSLDDAKAEMELFHVPVLLVVDDEQKIIGIITSEDILGEKPVKLSQEKRVPRSEIEVGMVMTPITRVIALDSDDLIHAKVGHIIQTLREVKQHTLLVLKDKILQGLFSASIISGQLDLDISQVFSEAQSIAELQHNLHH